MKIFYHLVNGLFLLVYWLFIASITLRILMKKRSASATVTWLLMIYILPLVGIIAYLLFGELRLGRRKAERAQAIWPSMAEWFSQLRKCHTLVAQSISPEALPLFRLCEQRQKIPPLWGNQLTLKTTPHAIFHALIQDIKAAQHCIDVVFYIWQDGGLVDQVSEELMEAARRGVRCRLLLDAAGSSPFWHSHYPALMRATGIQLVEALPVNPLRIVLQRIDLRQHRKMVLIDHHIAYTGSMNMADPRFFQPKGPIGQWVDLMVRIEGPTALVLGSIFAWDWEVETGERLLPPLPLNNAVPCTPLPETAVQVVASGPGFPEEMIHQTLLTAIYSARSRLSMTTPYFVPSDELLCAIILAAQRGVQVDLIVPKQNHSLLVKWASRSFFEPLLAAGVNLYQYEQGFLHTKSILVDNHLSLIGTVNLDMRSLWLNFEITVVIDDAAFGAELAEIQQNYRACSTAIEAARWAKRPLQQRIAERIFYFFSPLL